jgi:hypothetical protein
MKHKLELPPEKFLRRTEERISLCVMIPKSLKPEIVDECEVHNSSISGFVEAAIRWYIANLRK